MMSNRVLRITESSLVTLFFIQAARFMFATLLSMTSLALLRGQPSADLINQHLLLLTFVIVPWFVPRKRQSIPETLSVSAILVAVSRAVMSLPIALDVIRFYGAIAVMTFAVIYFVGLLRASQKNWILAMVLAFTLDQIFRAYDTYDISQRLFLNVSTGSGIPFFKYWFAVQVLFSTVLVVISRLVRKNAPREPYEPAHLSVLTGMAFGGLMAIELVALTSPPVLSHWTGVPIAAVVFWVLVATTLPLSVNVRSIVASVLSMFDERLRGWVYFFLFLLVLVIGERLDGIIATGALIIAQFLAISLIWWIPDEPETQRIDNIGPSMSLGLVLFVVLVYAYNLTFEPALPIAWLHSRALIPLLISAALLAMPRLFWREDDPWVSQPVFPSGFAFALVLLFSFGGFVLNAVDTEPPTAIATNTLRVATYNINGGYDELGVFQLEIIASTMEASLADVILLQEVDAGRSVAYGVDMVTYLSKRLNMYHAYYPTSNGGQGVAILSRWRLFEIDGATIPADGPDLGVVTGLIQNPITGHTVRLYGAQLAPADQEETTQQLSVLLSFVDNESPVILAFDLVDTDERHLYTGLITRGYLDPDDLLGIESGFTYPSDEPTERRDFVLVRDLVPIASNHVNSSASDHRLVVVEMGWP